MEIPVIQPGRKREGQTPIFQKIGIVGLGLIGGSIALAAREIWPASLVIAVDNKDVLETAMRLHAIDVAADDVVVLAEADLIILAAPVRQNLMLLETLDEHVRQPAVITDTGSTKRAIVEAAQGVAVAIDVHRRPSARWRGRERPRARAPGSLQGTALAVHAERRGRRRIAREARRVRAGAGRRAADSRRGGARSPARIPESPAAADGERADAGRRRRRWRRGARAWRDAASSTRRGSRRARPKSGGTSRTRTRTRFVRRSTR